MKYAFLFFMAFGFGWFLRAALDDAVALGDRWKSHLSWAGFAALDFVLVWFLWDYSVGYFLS